MMQTGALERAGSQGRGRVFQAQKGSHLPSDTAISCTVREAARARPPPTSPLWHGSLALQHEAHCQAPVQPSLARAEASPSPVPPRSAVTRT